MKHWRAASTLLLIGLLVGITFFNAPGTGDRYRWLLYMYTARHYGVLQTYWRAAVTGVSQETRADIDYDTEIRYPVVYPNNGNGRTDYPPLSILALALLARLGRLLHVSDFAMLKFSLIAFTLACAGVTAGWRDRWRPLLGIATFAALALSSIVLVYLEVYFILPLLLAFACLQRKKLTAGAALFTVSFLIKWQPIILVPFVLIYVLSQDRSPRRLLPFVPATLILAAVAAIFGKAMVVALGSGLQDTSFSGGALNFNWLIAAAQAHAFNPWHAAELSANGQDAIRALGNGTAPHVGVYGALALLSTTLRYFCYAVALAHFVFSGRTFADLVRACIAAFLSYSIFGVGVHENHAIVAMVLALCWVAVDRTRYLEATALAVSFNLNLFILYGFRGHGPEMSRILGWDVTIYLALFSLAIFAAIWTPLAIELGRKLAQLRASRPALAT
jgi:hypothetical protein